MLSEQKKVPLARLISFMNMKAKNIALKKRVQIE